MDIVADSGNKLRSVAGCIRSGVVVLKHSTRGSQKEDGEWVHDFSNVSCVRSGRLGHVGLWRCLDPLSLHMCLSCPRHSRRSGCQPSQRHLIHTSSIAFRHLPPNSARFSYATEGALFFSAQLSMQRRGQRPPKGSGTNTTVEAT